VNFFGIELNGLFDEVILVGRLQFGGMDIKKFPGRGINAWLVSFGEKNVPSLPNKKNNTDNTHWYEP
jgi:hypothetical protein